MKSISFVFCGLLLLSINCFSFPDPQDIYKADRINEELKKDAYTVKRLDKAELEISGPDKLKLHQHEVVTILNEKGKSALIFYISTSKFRTLEDVDIRLYDKNGALIEKYKKKDLSSQAENSELVEDGIIYYKKLTTGSYPVTIEKEYTLRYNGIFQLPGFSFLEPYQALEYGVLQVTYPSAMKVNFKAYNIQEKPSHQNEGNQEVLEFHVKNLPVKKYEDDSGPYFKDYPRILFNAEKIEYDGYPGNASTWTDMGFWYNSLVKNVNKLSIPHQDEVRKLVEGAASDKDKIRILYEYLQRNFRYVSIQLGIGGFKPFAADFVHEKKYGDCKGLSNYMEACLAAVNIKSYSAWIRAGDDETYLDTEFAHDIFNHQILMVPLDKDTIWLECTSNYNEFGHLGSFTENRYALVLTENGGKLVKTPVSKAADNTISAFTDVNIAPEWSAVINTRFLSTGKYKYDMVDVSRATADVHKQYAVNYFGLNNPNEFSMDFGAREKFPYPSGIHVVVEKIYDFKAGAKLFIRPRLYKLWQYKMKVEEKRTQDFYLTTPMSKTDTTAFHLPEGYSLESLPKDKNISFALGKYESHYWVDEKTRTIFSTARLVINSYKIEPSLYEQARLFFDQVMDDGNQKIVCKSNF